MRDVLGNELKVGDLVLIQLDRPMMFGEVVEISEGGLLAVSQLTSPGVQPGKVTVICRHAVMFDPRNNCGALLALRDDSSRVRIGDGQNQPPMDKPN